MRKISLITVMLFSLGSTSVFAQNYYVKPDGNNNSDGRSHATAWKTVSKVNSYSFNTGDDVYFLSGGKWMNEQLVVDWAGSSTNPVVIGSYYMNNGNETVGVLSGKSKPTFDENWPASGTIISSTDYYTGLILVKAKYVTIQDLRISNSIKNGVQLGSGGYSIVNRVDTDVTAAAGIRIFTNNNIVKNSTVRESSLGKKLGQWPGGSYPACIVVVGNTHNIIEKNYIYDCYGEGIGFYKTGADHNIARDNTIIGTKPAGIYIDRGNYNIAERNIISGTTDTKYWEGSGIGPGMAVNTEGGGQHSKAGGSAIGNIFRNNLISYMETCLWVGAMATGEGRSGVEFVGNTCVGTKTFVAGNAKGDRVDKVIVKNNIFHQAVNSDSCAASDSSAYIFDNNLWPVKQSNSTCQGSNDVIGDPQLNRTSGWRTLSSSNRPDVTDFTPKEGSIALLKGVSHGSLGTDYHNNKRPSSPTLGAIELSPTLKILQAPTGVVFSVVNN